MDRFTIVTNGSIRTEIGIYLRGYFSNQSGIRRKTRECFGFRTLARVLFDVSLFYCTTSFHITSGRKGLICEHSALAV